MRNLRRHAIVIGASMAGLTSARVLADHFDAVTVLDRDALPPDDAPRKGVPQGRHAHALLAGGAVAITQLFPGIMEEMVAEGAAVLDFNEGTWFQAGGYRAASLVERKVISASRPFLEGHVRRRVASVANVTVQDGVAVDGLLQAGTRVRGVRIRGEHGVEAMEADLVVDCSGRSSRAPAWLVEAGFAAPEVVEVRCDMRYATMQLRLRPEDVPGAFAVVIESPPKGKRAAILLPIEDDRWILTLGSGYGASGPVNEAELRGAVAMLPAPTVHDATVAGEALGPVATHRFLTSKRQRYEKLRRVPSGFLVLGDAICSFNPIYGQGMSSAVLQAVELGRCLGEVGDDEAMVRTFYRRAAKVIATPWQIAVGADFAYPECTGPKPFGTDLVNRYMRQVLVAAQVSPEVNTAMVMVQNLVQPPSTLMRPSMIRTVRRAARQARLRPAASAAPTRRREPQPA